MTDGTSQGLFVVVAIVIFGIFVALSYTVFGSDGLSRGLNGLFSQAVEETSIAVSRETPAEYFEFDADNQAITGYTGSFERVAIPREINGIAVEHIAHGAFSTRDISSASLGHIPAGSEQRIREIILPKGLVSIGGYSFSHNDIEKVILPNTVTFLNTGAFKYNKIAEVYIPYSVDTLNISAFEVNNLTEVWLPEHTTYVIGGSHPTFDSNVEVFTK